MVKVSFVDDRMYRGEIQIFVKVSEASVSGKTCIPNTDAARKPSSNTLMITFRNLNCFTFTFIMDTKNLRILEK